MQSLRPGGGGLRGGPMPGSPFVTSVGYGNSATLRSHPEMRSVLLLAPPPGIPVASWQLNDAEWNEHEYSVRKQWC